MRSLSPHESFQMARCFRSLTSPSQWRIYRKENIEFSITGWNLRAKLLYKHHPDPRTPDISNTHYDTGVL